MSLVDVAMVGHLGPEALAATGMGGMLAWGTLSIVLGIRTSVQTITSRRLGQKKPEECISALNNGFLLASIYSIPVSLLGWTYGYLIIPLFITDSITTPIAISYFSISSIGIFFNALSFVFQGFYTGIEKTKVHLSVTITSNIINAYLNAGFIYGKDKIGYLLGNHTNSFFDFSDIWFWADFEGMGVTGAAIGTLISSFWMMGHYFYYLNKQKIIIDNNGFLKIGLNREMLKKQIKLSFPMGFQEMMIAVGYSFFYKIMSLIGILELATTQLLFTIMHASFMPAIGVGQACATYVGKFLGEKKPNKAERSIWESIRIAEYIMGTMGVSFMLFPHFFLNFFTQDAQVLEMGVPGLRILGVLQFVDAVGLPLWFSLTAAGNTLFPAVTEVLILWLWSIPLSLFLGVYMGYGFFGSLFPLVVHYLLFALTLGWKIKRGTWKEIEI